MRRLTRVGMGLAVGVVALGLVACSASSNKGDTSSGGAPAPDYGDSAAYDSESAYDAGGYDTSGTADGVAAQAVVNEAEIIKTGTLYLIADDPAAVFEQAKAVVAAAGGKTDNASVYSVNDQLQTRAEATLRVPVDQFARVENQLKELAEVQSWSETAEDVTTQVLDLQARIESLETSIDRLEELMGESAGLDDLLELESTITTRQGELDSLKAQRTYLADKVGLSTINLTIRPVAVDTPKPTRTGFVGGLERGWNGLLGFLTDLSRVAGTLLPWLPLIAVVVLAPCLVARGLRRRRRERLARMFPQTQPQPVSQTPTN
ncbi:MAG: DUF4349 domain-containing protein [Bifidobacteriaceae bacterium]|nr:DUF4349 domain-containing protein [Bifidobacteriaceae bacterium]